LFSQDFHLCDLETTRNSYRWCSAILAHFILKEKLHIFGMLGCALCVVGSTTIVLHAPHEKVIHSVKEVWQLATEPGTFWSLNCLSLSEMYYGLFLCCLKRNSFLANEFESLRFPFPLMNEQLLLYTLVGWWDWF
jgi:hypothetical protein